MIPDPDLSVRHFDHPGPWAPAGHAHEAGQLFVLRRGACVFQAGDSDWVMTPGRPCWVPPGHLHRVASVGPVAGVSLFLGAALCQDLPERAMVVRSTAFLLALIDRLAAVLADPGRRGRLLVVLADELAAAEPDVLHLPLPHEPRLRRLAATLAADPADGRTLDAWSAALGIPKRTLVRRLRKETGLSFVEWRRRARVMAAIQRLDGNMTVTDAAFEVGYDSVSAFIAAFRRTVGCSPGDYAARSGAAGVHP